MVVVLSLFCNIHSYSIVASVKKLISSASLKKILQEKIVEEIFFQVELSDSSYCDPLP